MRNVKVDSGPVYWKRLNKPTLNKALNPPPPPPPRATLGQGGGGGFVGVPG